MALRTTGDITEDAQGRGAWGEATPKPPPGGGATSPPCSRPRPCLQRREGQRPAGPWRAGASRRRHVTGRRPRPGVWLRHGGPHRDGPQGQPHEGRGRGWGRRAVTGCSHGAVPSGHLFPGELWLRKSDSVPRPNRPNPGPPMEVQPTKVKGRRNPSAPQPCPRGQASPHLEETMGRRGEAAPPLPEGREEGTRWKSQAATVRGRTRGGVVGAAAPMWARPLARQQQRDSGPSPHLPPAPLLCSVCGVLLNSRSPSPLQSSSPGSDQHVAIWGSCVIM